MLQHQVDRRINYRIPEAASILGIDYPRLNKLLSDGQLKAIQTSDGVKWITSGSIIDLLNRIGIYYPMDNEDNTNVVEETRIDIPVQDTKPVTEDLPKQNKTPVTGAVRSSDNHKPSESRKQNQSNVTANTNSAKTVYKQFYWYYVDGNATGLPSLREALKAVKFNVSDTSQILWNKIPADIKKRIRREPTNS
jgi:hypothetical protein